MMVPLTHSLAGWPGAGPAVTVTVGGPGGGLANPERLSRPWLSPSQIGLVRPLMIMPDDPCGRSTSDHAR
jgi:hypothetical protein